MNRGIGQTQSKFISVHSRLRFPDWFSAIISLPGLTLSTLAFFAEGLHSDILRTLC